MEQELSGKLSSRWTGHVYVNDNHSDGQRAVRRAILMWTGLVMCNDIYIFVFCPSESSLSIKILHFMFF